MSTVPKLPDPDRQLEMAWAGLLRGCHPYYHDDAEPDAVSRAYVERILTMLAPHLTRRNVQHLRELVAAIPLDNRLPLDG